MYIIVAGPDDDDLAAALESEGAEVSRIDDAVSASPLEAAGIDRADALVLTDLAEATGFTVAAERNPDAKLVAYAEGSLPEYASGLADLSVDPNLMEPAVFAEELVDD